MTLETKRRTIDEPCGCKVSSNVNTRVADRVKSRRRGRGFEIVVRWIARGRIFTIANDKLPPAGLIDGPVDGRKGKRQTAKGDSPSVCSASRVCTRLMPRPITPRSDRQNRGAPGARTSLARVWSCSRGTSSRSVLKFIDLTRRISGCQCMHAIRGDFIARVCPRNSIQFEARLVNVRERSRTFVRADSRLLNRSRFSTKEKLIETPSFTFVDEPPARIISPRIERNFSLNAANSHELCTYTRKLITALFERGRDVAFVDVDFSLPRCRSAFVACPQPRAVYHFVR